MTTTAVILQSGHNLASGDQLYSAVMEHIAKLNKVPDADSHVLGLTEMAAGKFDNPLEEAASDSGLHLYHPVPRGPSEIAFLSSRPIARKTYSLLTEKRLDPKVTARNAGIFVVGIRPRGDDFFGGWHSPAHNEGLAKPHNHAAQVWIDAVRHGLKRWRTGLPGRPTLMGDWNVRPDNPNAERIFRQTFPRMKWAGDDSQRPTEGGRVIDGFLTRRRVVVSAKTLRALPGFDHKAVLTVLG